MLRRALLEDATVPEAALRALSEATGRPVNSAAEGVAQIVADVRARGDEALRFYSRVLDGCEVGALELPRATLEAAYQRLDSGLREALDVSAARIRRFHERQAAAEQGWLAEEGDSRLGQLVRPLERVGIYAPGGQALYPSSVLMNAVPAKVAGVGRVVMVVPTPDGVINPAVLVAAQLAGVDEIYRVGGAQAVAALAYGTATIAPVAKIVGRCCSAT